MSRDGVSILKLFALGLILGAAYLSSLHSGPVDLTWSEIFSYFTNSSLNKENSFLLGALRVPRSIATLVVGSSLGICGMILQTLLKNPLAEPYTLGLSGGSALGAIIALYLGFEPAVLWVPVFSSLGCLVATAIVLGFGRSRLEFESRSLILFGVMVSLFFGALVVTGLSILSPTQLQSALFWLLGQFGTSRDAWIYKICPFLFLAMILALSKYKSLDALTLGEARAYSLGYSPRLERSLLILLCTFMTALAVSVSGLVGFIGLVSPHITRKVLKTSQSRFLLVGSAFVGGIMLTFADSLARNVGGNTEIPAGSIAALLGAPVLVFLLIGNRHAAAE